MWAQWCGVRSLAALFNGANDCVRRYFSLFDQFQHRHRDLFHVFGKMNGQLLPAAADIATKLADLIPWLVFCLKTAGLHQLPDFVRFVLLNVGSPTLKRGFVMYWLRLAATGAS